MSSRFMALALLGPLTLLAILPAPAATRPVPAPTPLKTIKHVYATRLCTGLRRSIAPAVGHVLQNDRTIATSRPLFEDYVRNNSTNSQGGTDMDVVRMERLIDPLVKNTELIEKLLSDPIYSHRSQNESDKQLQKMRAHLAQVLGTQKRALDLISGFVDTEQMGELQAAGHEYDKSINATGTTNAKNDPNNAPPATSPTAPPNNILGAGLPVDDATRKNDPRYTNTGSTLGYNPLNAFDQQMENYQMQIFDTEHLAAQEIVNAVPQCGGKVPAAPAPYTPVPMPVVPLPSATPSAKP